MVEEERVDVASSSRPSKRVGWRTASVCSFLGLEGLGSSFFAPFVEWLLLETFTSPKGGRATVDLLIAKRKRKTKRLCCRLLERAQSHPHTTVYGFLNNVDVDVILGEST